MYKNVLNGFELNVDSYNYKFYPGASFNPESD